MNPIMLLATLACFADPSGHWEGALKTPVGEMAFEVDLMKNAAGDFVGAVNQPSEHLTGLPLADIAVEGQDVRFQIKGVRGERAFKGELSEDGKSISGVFHQSSYSVPFSLSRTGEARMEAAARSTSISKELEGVWNGTLEAKGNQIRAVLTLANQSDGTATGSLATVDDGLDIPIAGITQKGSTVTLDLKAVGGTFSGTLHADGTELTGIYTQGTLAAALTFRRSRAGEETK